MQPAEPIGNSVNRARQLLKAPFLPFPFTSEVSRVLIARTRPAILATRRVREDRNTRTTIGVVAPAMLQLLVQNVVTRWHESVTRKEIEPLTGVQIRRRLISGPQPRETAR
jgi:hypothetical protein